MQRSSELVMLAVLALGAAGYAERGSSTDGSAPVASTEASSVGSWFASGVSREGGDDSVGSWYASEASREDVGESSVGSWYASEASRDGGDDSVGSWYAANEEGGEGDGDSSVGSWYSSERSETD